LAVKEWYRIHRQDAKDAKNFAKQNSFQESKPQVNCRERAWTKPPQPMAYRALLLDVAEN
jgi:hypothetical protein